MVMRTRLLGVRCLEDAIQLFSELGYSAEANPIDLGQIPLPDAVKAFVSRSADRRRFGYGLCFIEVETLPSSLKPLARGWPSGQITTLC